VRGRGKLRTPAAHGTHDLDDLRLLNAIELEEAAE